jgi:hypothetical protein
LRLSPSRNAATWWRLQPSPDRQPFPLLKVDHLEHYPTADHQVGGRPGCMVIFHGGAPSTEVGAAALARLFGLKGWTISPSAADPNSAGPFSRAAYAWLAQSNQAGG